MQSAAGRRALSFLASKLHRDPLPLSPRESAQLLNLLTTSFRAHLDRAHPVAGAENTATQQSPPHSAAPGRRRPRDGSPAHASSSQLSAREHIESILTNPLFAHNPRRRLSDASKATAQAALRDPLGWFLDQAAMGTADLSTARTCLHMLQTKSAETDAKPMGTVPARSQPATQIAEWLNTSGLAHSRDFVAGDQLQGLLNLLAPMLAKEGREDILFDWFVFSPKLRAEETGVTPAKISNFRARLLRAIVGAKLTIDESLAIFLHANKMLSNPESGVERKTLLPAGFRIINQMIAQSKSEHSSELHEAFTDSCKAWAFERARGVEAILRLYHPTSPTASFAVAYIRDPEGIAHGLAKAKPGTRYFYLNLCLQTARQCLAEQNYPDAQFVLMFTSNNFPDLVGKQQKEMEHKQKEMEHKREEDKNLEMLDQLLPA